MLTEKTYASINDEALATIFAMAQQNSIKLACQLIFEQTLYVRCVLYEIIGVTHFYVSRALPIISRFGIAVDRDNMDLFREHVKMALRFLPFWNLVSKPT